MPSLKLIKAAVDSQLVEALSALLEEAKAGRITGLAYVTLEPGAGFSADVLGSARRNRLIALGITKTLEEAVSRLHG